MNNRAVSPIVGTLLLIALVVVLVGFVSTFLFDFTEFQQEPVVDLDVSHVEDNSDVRVDVAINRNENVDSMGYRINNPDGSTVPVDSGSVEFSSVAAGNVEEIKDVERGAFIIIIGNVQDSQFTLETYRVPEESP